MRLIIKIDASEGVHQDLTSKQLFCWGRVAGVFLLELKHLDMAFFRGATILGPASQGPCPE
ncbi:unnamed protein product, partial [Bubo scandiacus]